MQQIEYRRPLFQIQIKVPKILEQIKKNANHVRIQSKVNLLTLRIKLHRSQKHCLAILMANLSSKNQKIKKTSLIQGNQS